MLDVACLTITKIGSVPGKSAASEAIKHAI